MPSKSKSQQRFFGAVVSCKETKDCASAKIKKTAAGISLKDAKDFARNTIKKETTMQKSKSNLVPFSVWLESKDSGCKCNCDGCTKGKNCDKCVCKKCTCKGCDCKN